MDRSLKVAPPQRREPLAYRLVTPVEDRRVPWTDDQLARAYVRCGRPLIYDIPAADLPGALRRRAELTGRRYCGAVFAFDLGDLPQRRYVALHLSVHLSDERVLASQIQVDGSAAGLPASAPPVTVTDVGLLTAAAARPGWLRRLTGRQPGVRAWASGLRTHQFSWHFEADQGVRLPPRSYGVHALLELPEEVTEVRGRLAVRVELGDLADDTPQRWRASLGDVLSFAEPVARAEHPAASVRLCMAADVIGYSGRSNRASEDLQRRLVALLASARRAAGIDDHAVRPQPQGDGEFTVLPAGIDESQVIPALIQGLERALADDNRSAEPSDRIRLRLALHRGLLKPGDNGWVGRATIAVHRILDSPALHAAACEHPEADLVVGIPDVLYQDVIRLTEAHPGPDDFTPFTVDLPAKEFVEPAWLYLGAVAGHRPRGGWTGVIERPRAAGRDRRAP